MACVCQVWGLLCPIALGLLGPSFAVDAYKGKSLTSLSELGDDHLLRGQPRNVDLEVCQGQTLEVDDTACLPWGINKSLQQRRARKAARRTAAVLKSPSEHLYCCMRTLFWSMMSEIATSWPYSSP